MGTDHAERSTYADERTDTETMQRLARGLAFVVHGPAPSRAFTVERTPIGDGRWHGTAGGGLLKPARQTRHCSDLRPRCRSPVCGGVGASPDAHPEPAPPRRGRRRPGRPPTGRPATAYEVPIVEPSTPRTGPVLHRASHRRRPDGRRPGPQAHTAMAASWPHGALQPNPGRVATTPGSHDPAAPIPRARSTTSSTVPAPALSSGTLPLPHFGDCTHDGQPARHAQSSIAARVAASHRSRTA